MHSVSIHVITMDAGRLAKMQARLGAVGLPFTVEHGVDRTDARMQDVAESNRHAAPCMLAHLDAISSFLRTDKELGIICEDDVHIARTLAQDLEVVTAEFRHMRLDILLLGYLLPLMPRADNHAYRIKSKYTYHTYSDDLWVLRCT
jgi:GR25 family glycosyltransferase involved in LPS biosynthesis